jgi:hypothetical protein
MRGTRTSNIVAVFGSGKIDRAIGLDTPLIAAGSTLGSGLFKPLVVGATLLVHRLVSLPRSLGRQLAPSTLPPLLQLIPPSM